MDYSGRVFLINDQTCNFKSELYFDQYDRVAVRIYNVPIETYRLLHDGCRAISFISENDVKCVFVYDPEIIKCVGSYNSEDEKNIFEEIVIQASYALVGSVPVTAEKRYQSVALKVTDGFEIIGNLPFAVERSSFNEGVYKRASVHSFAPKSINVNTVTGEYTFRSWAKKDLSTDGLCFDHEILYKPNSEVCYSELRELLHILSDFLEILCGEEVTINEVNVSVADTNEIFQFHGLCNYKKEYLNLFENELLDHRAYKRISLFKLTDFSDLQLSLNEWISNYDRIKHVNEAYKRILLTEELRIVTVDKYLTAMQLIEGFSNLGKNEEEEKQKFEEKKKHILSLLQNEDDISFAQDFLSFSGGKFRKDLINYLYNGILVFCNLSNTQLKKKYDKLIGRIKNERDKYTHLPVHNIEELTFEEKMRIARIIKEFYRIEVLLKCGLSEETIKCRFSVNRSFAVYLKELIDIDVPSFDRPHSQFDEQMWTLNTEQTDIAF